MKNRNCLKCNKIIPYHIKVDGRRKSLQRRKYCTECSPYKSNKRGGNDKKKISFKERYAKWSEEKKKQHAQKITNRGKERKLALINLSGGKCKKCGYNDKNYTRSFSFHHRNPSEKSFDLCANIIRATDWDKVLEELKKCDLYCIRCHQEIEEDLSR